MNAATTFTRSLLPQPTILGRGIRASHGGRLRISLRLLLSGNRRGSASSRLRARGALFESLLLFCEALIRWHGYLTSDACANDPSVSRKSKLPSVPMWSTRGQCFHPGHENAGYVYLMIEDGSDDIYIQWSPFICTAAAAPTRNKTVDNQQLAAQDRHTL